MAGMIMGLLNWLYNKVLARIPFHAIRLFFLRLRVGRIGKDSAILLNVEFRIHKNISIGDHTIINSRVLLDGRGGKLTIGNNVDIAQETNIWTLQHDVQDDYHSSTGGDVEIADYVWVASRVTILPGVKIGRGAVVACNSVVTRDVEPMTIVAGIPAKKIGERKSGLSYTLKHAPWFE